MKKTCPCCGYKTLDKNRLFAVCSICRWSDDPVQAIDPDYKDGANPSLSLREAQAHFTACGACHPTYTNESRPPSEDDIKDTHFVYHVKP